MDHLDFSRSTTSTSLCFALPCPFAVACTTETKHGPTPLATDQPTVGGCCPCPARATERVRNRNRPAGPEYLPHETSCHNQACSSSQFAGVRRPPSSSERHTYMPCRTEDETRRDKALISSIFTPAPATLKRHFHLPVSCPLRTRL